MITFRRSPRIACLPRQTMSRPTHPKVITPMLKMIKIYLSPVMIIFNPR